MHNDQTQVNWRPKFNNYEANSLCALFCAPMYQL